MQLLDENTDQNDRDESENTMAVLSTLGGGEQPPEGQPLGMETDTAKPKLSGSTLAVAVVVVVGLGALFALKTTLRASATDANTAEAMQKVEDFMVKLAAAEQGGTQGPIEASSGESEQIIHELETDPTDHQVPSEDVQKNPFEMVGIERQEAPTGPVITGPTPEEIEARELARYQAIARGFHIDSISGRGDKAVVFIDGNMYRIGDEIGGTGFTINQVDGLDVIVRAPAAAPKPWAFRLHYE